MKQGQATHSAMGDQKREPISHPVSPGAAARIGGAQANAPFDAVHSGRGVQAPAPAAQTSHPSGSQGKHR